MSLPHHHSGKFVKNCPIVNSLWTVNTKYLFVFNCKAVRVPSVASCHWAKFSNQIQIVADHDKYFMFISPSIKQKPGLSQNICICIESEMSVICPLVHLSRSRLIIAIVNHRCLLTQCPGQHTAHIGTQATAATRKKLWWQRAMRTWSLPSLPPLLVSSIRLFVPADPWSCPGGSHEARLRVWWWTISLSTILSSPAPSGGLIGKFQQFSSPWPEPNIRIGHTSLVVPVPGTRCPPSTGLITSTSSGHNSHHAAHHRDLILNWHDQVSRRDRKFLCPILLSFCIFTFSKQAPRLDTHSCRLTEGDRGELNWQWMVWWPGCGFCGALFSQLKLIYFSTLISQEKL